MKKTEKQALNPFEILRAIPGTFSADLAEAIADCIASTEKNRRKSKVKIEISIDAETDSGEITVAGSVEKKLAKQRPTHLAIHRDEFGNIAKQELISEEN